MNTTNLLFILISFLTLVSCTAYKNEGTLLNSDLEKALEACKPNGGINKIHAIKRSFKTVCENQAVLIHKYKDESNNIYTPTDENPVILKSDLNNCKTLCENNTGVKQINSFNFCSKERIHIRLYVCHEESATITCFCNNGIEKTETRVVKENKF